MFPDRVKKFKNRLNDTEIEILRYLLKIRTTINQYTIKEVAHANYVSINTVVRLAKKLKYDNFTDLKYAIYYSDIGTKKASPSECINDFSDSSLMSIANTINIINDNELIKVAHDIFFAENCYAFGIGDSEYFAGLLSKNLLAYNKKITVLNKIYEVENVISESMKSDLIILVSATGETPEVVRMLDECLKKDIKVVAFTSERESRLYNEVANKILFDYQFVVKRGINISDLSGIMYATMNFVDVYRQLFGID